MDCSSDEMNQKLAEEAYAAMKHAYAPYSHFRVGWEQEQDVPGCPKT